MMHGDPDDVPYKIYDALPFFSGRTKKSYDIDDFFYLDKDGKIWILADHMTNDEFDYAVDLFINKEDIFKYKSIIKIHLRGKPYFMKLDKPVEAAGRRVLLANDCKYNIPEVLSLVIKFYSSMSFLKEFFLSGCPTAGKEGEKLRRAFGFLYEVIRKGDCDSVGLVDDEKRERMERSVADNLSFFEDIREIKDIENVAFKLIEDYEE